ncbi:MAG: hypothetical protein SO152_05980 [Ruminococcus sp.]|nr:hypothetical protein [Ruminococcus sp.]
MHLRTTLNDYVAIGVKKTVLWTVCRESFDDMIANIDFCDSAYK